MRPGPGGDGLRAVALTGDLDYATVPEIDRFLRRSFGPFFFRRHLLFDLAAVTFIDSSFMSYVVRLAGRVRREGYELILAGPAGQARRVIGMVGLANVVPVLETVDEALALLAAGTPIIPPAFGVHAADPSTASAAAAD